MGVEFEWDIKKASANIIKHKISFEEALTVFDDPLAFIFDDIDHSLDEHREIIIGHSIAKRLLIVCFVERKRDVVRIFSACKVTRKEHNDYENQASFKIPGGR